MLELENTAAKQDRQLAFGVFGFLEIFFIKAAFLVLFAALVISAVFC